MNSRKLGQTPIEVTPIGLGLAALGRPAYINLGREDHLPRERSPEAMEQRTHQLLDAAYDRGVRYFDTARSYGRAEAFLGSWLRTRGIEPSQVSVGSKWGYTYVADWRMEASVHEVKEHSTQNFQRQIAESQDLLGPLLSLYQIHSATLETGVLEDRAVLSALAGLRDRGTAIGFSVSGPGQGDTIRRALEVEAGGSPLFASVQATWNLLETSAGPALWEAHAAGLGVIIKEGLANGRLAGDVAPQPLKHAAARFGLSPDALALAAALARPWVNVVLSGAATVAQLASNCNALQVSWTDTLEAELGGLATPPRDYWAHRSGLPWR